MKKYTSQQLIDFEEDIAECFNNAMIKAPVHLYNGNEDIMLDIFKKIDIENDWVFCTWRNHYQALCKGVPQNYLKDKILKGKSMVMNLPEYKIFCSSIVGGVTPIAMGTALAIKLKKSTSKVWCFLGDMSAETGAFHESYKYSLNFDLPITWIIEDNFKSVLTPTQEVWGRKIPYYIDESKLNNNELYHHNKIIYYRYQNDKYPHAGAGIRVQF